MSELVKYLEPNLPKGIHAIAAALPSTAITQNLKITGNYSPVEHDFVTKRGTINYWKNISFPSIEKVLQKNTPSIGQIAKYEGKEEAKRKIVYILAKHFKGRENVAISEVDMLLIADSILSPVKIKAPERLGRKHKEIGGGYPYMNIGDLHLCILMGIMGKFGKPYGKIFIHDLMGDEGWFEMYFKFQSEAKSEYRKNQIDILPKPSHKAVPCPEHIKEKWRQAEKNLRMERQRESQNKSQYLSIADYCEQNNLDTDEFVKLKSKGWMKEYGKVDLQFRMEPFQFINEKVRIFLFLQNSNR